MCTWSKEPRASGAGFLWQSLRCGWDGFRLRAPSGQPRPCETDSSCPKVLTREEPTNRGGADEQTNGLNHDPRGEPPWPLLAPSGELTERGINVRLIVGAILTPLVLVGALIVLTKS